MATYYDPPRTFNVQSLTIPANDLSASGTHGLGAAPNAILINPQDVYGQATYAPVSEATVTTFKVYQKDAQGADAVLKVVLT